MAGAVKTSGAKGLHVFVPLAGGSSPEDVAAATRAVAVRAERIDPDLATTAFVKDEREGKVFLDSTRAGGATVVSRLQPTDPARAYPCRFRSHGTTSMRSPRLTSPSTTRPDCSDGADPWADQMPPAQPLDADLVAEGHTVPVARVQAMHEANGALVRVLNPDAR